MSLATIIGGNGNILSEDKNFAHSITLKQPILNNEQLEKLRSIDTGNFQAKQFIHTSKQMEILVA